MQLTVPIIALTANAFQNEIDKCIAAGMNSYVTKPFEEKDLMEKIYQAVKQPVPEALVQPVVNPDEGSSRPLFTLRKLEALSHGDRNFIKKMLQIFTENMPVMLTQIQDAVESRDVEVIRSVSHKMKPTLDNLGIDSLHDVVRSLEKITVVDLAARDLARRLVDTLSEVLRAVRKIN